MHLQSYRWTGCFTGQELSVLRKSLAIASGADESKVQDLDEREAEIAARMARVIGGVYAAKRAERQNRQGGGNDRDDADFSFDGEDGSEDDGHQHSVPTGAENRQRARQ